MGERVVVMGLGRSGRAAAALAVQDGCDVVGVDLRSDIEPVPGATFELGPHRRELFLEADRIIVSPGIPTTQPDLRAAHEAGVPIVGELAFAAAHLDLPMAAVTGTNGKSTVTWFTGQLLRAAGLRPFVGGNLGNPLSNAALHDSEPHDVAVVEVSSYQLEWPGDFNPKVGVILNLTPDHLARHGDMDGYAAAKARLFERMGPTNLAVLPAGNDRLRAASPKRGTRAWIGKLPGVVRDGNKIHVDIQSHRIHASFDLKHFPIPGEHNKDNAATAALLALALGATPGTVASTLPRLRALAHRMEVVGTVGGVTWINDSKATNVDAALVGISGNDRPAVVLLGGQAKGPGFAVLADALRTQRATICFGGSGPAIADELEGAGVAVVRVASMADAVHHARALAEPGDAVLLSPGCASFDAFDDFEHRGRVFAALVQEMQP